jgi:hypothetical protein
LLIIILITKLYFIEFSNAGGPMKRITSLAVIPGNLGLVAGMGNGGIRFYAWPITETFARDTSQDNAEIGL